MTAIFSIHFYSLVKDMILINDCDIIRVDKLNNIETIEFPNSTCILTCQLCKLNKLVNRNFVLL